MSVREHLQLQLGVANQVRWVLIVVVAAALAWIYPGQSVRLFQRVWIFAAVLLYLWSLGALLGALLGAPMAQLRCPRCTGKFAFRTAFASCPHCNVSFDAVVRREWPGMSPLSTRSRTL